MIYDLPELWIDEAQDLSDADFYEELQLDADNFFDESNDLPDDDLGSFDIDSFDW